MRDRVEVPFKKARLVKIVLIVCLFIAAGIWILIDPRIDEYIPRYLNKLKLALPFIVLPVLFGWQYFIKLFDKGPGLVIDENGITDNSPDLAIGLIPWSDIKRFSILKKKSREYLLIEVADPKSYINQQKGGFKRNQMEYFLKKHGAAIYISNRMLDCDMYWLQSILEHRKIRSMCADKY